MIIVNSSPLIILGKQGMLSLLKKCFKKAIIPKTVYDEVMQEKDSPESVALRKAIRDKWIFVETSVVNPILNTKKIGQGEKEAISLAVKHGITLIIDDDYGKTYASILDVEAHGTLYVVFLARMKNFISKEEATDILKNMIMNGFYISTNLYSRFLELLNSLK